LKISYQLASLQDFLLKYFTNLLDKPAVSNEFQHISLNPRFFSLKTLTQFCGIKKDSGLKPESFFNNYYINLLVT